MIGDGRVFQFNLTFLTLTRCGVRGWPGALFAPARHEHPLKANWSKFELIQPCTTITGAAHSSATRSMTGLVAAVGALRKAARDLTSRGRESGSR